MNEKLTAARIFVARSEARKHLQSRGITQPKALINLKPKTVSTIPQRGYKLNPVKCEIVRQPEYECPDVYNLRML